MFIISVASLLLYHISQFYKRKDNAPLGHKRDFMISKKFIIDYMNLFFPYNSEKHDKFMRIIEDFTNQYIEAANMAVLAVDKDRKIVMVNHLASALLETAGASLIDHRVEDVLPDSPLKEITCENYMSIPKQFEMQGKTLYAERSPITHDDTVLAVASFFYNITDTTNTSESLNQAHKNELFLNEIIDNSYDGIYITDNKGKTILVNKAYERISGISRSQLIGEYIQNLVSSGLISTSITKDVVSGKKTVTRTQTNANNKEVLITGTPIFDTLGNVRHVITNVRDITELISLNNKLQAEITRADMYQSQLLKESSDENIAYGSREFENVLSISKKISKMDSTVLILGETGVGKEIIAQYIHKHSNRENKPYIKINCGAIPQNLLESELFGYVPGAFTGASSKGKPGLFELADTGTLFLDEIGELPINLQSALLRVLQDGEVTRVGSSKSNKVDVRIITATNRDLEEMIEEGTFRSDLYYRLNVVSVNIPPLRERKADIPFLAEKTIQDLNKKYKVEKALTPNFIQLLMRKDWPGNIRELKNFIEKQFVLSDDNIIDVPAAHNQFKATEKSNASENGAGLPQQDLHLPTYAEAKEAMERDLFKRALEQGKSTYKAAALLDMSQSTFFRKYKELFPNGVE